MGGTSFSASCVLFAAAGIVTSGERLMFCLSRTFDTCLLFSMFAARRLRKKTSMAATMIARMARDPMTAPAMAPELGEEPPESFDVVATPALEVVVDRVLVDRGEELPELPDSIELAAESVAKRLSGCEKDRDEVSPPLGPQPHQ